jgi:hypothetical protein
MMGGSVRTSSHPSRPLPPTQTASLFICSENLFEREEPAAVAEDIPASSVTLLPPPHAVESFMLLGGGLKDAGRSSSSQPCRFRCGFFHRSLVNSAPHTCLAQTASMLADPRSPLLDGKAD